VRGLAGMRKTAHCAELAEDASLVGDYGSAGSPYCAVWLTMANSIECFLTRFPEGYAGQTVTIWLPGRPDLATLRSWSRLTENLSTVIGTGVNHFPGSNKHQALPLFSVNQRQILTDFLSNTDRNRLLIEKYIYIYL
jgi:hypothetical protein